MITRVENGLYFLLSG